ncbi:hypothetical protein GA0115259_105847 [Streptomyces sp. MnatMP-M17]|nr:hypothetical protein GA0115259_105847 [Streptomyces sp. MnatMP-M17]
MVKICFDTEEEIYENAARRLRAAYAEENRRAGGQPRGVPYPGKTVLLEVDLQKRWLAEVARSDAPPYEASSDAETPGETVSRP